jgi:hypothetical protein
MKTIFLKTAYCFCLLLLFAAGCEKNDDNNDPDNGSNGSLSSGLSIDKTTIDAAYTAGTYPLQVTATQAWSAEVNTAATWCTISPDTYAGSRAVTVNVEENPTVGVQRVATITFTSGTLTRTVAIAQVAIAPILTADPTAIESTAGAASHSVAVTSNLDWTAAVSAGATWCTVSPATGTENGTVTVNVALNAATASRVATVTITAGTLTRAVSVTQAAFTFTVNEINDAPTYAASNKAWLIDGYAKVWSDAIQMPECNKASFANSETTPQCRSFEINGKTFYYYNQQYVKANYSRMCPSPWSMRIWDGSVYGESGRHPALETAAALWGYGGYAQGSGIATASGMFLTNDSWFSGSCNHEHYLAQQFLVLRTDGYYTNYSCREWRGLEVRCVK